MPTAMHLYIIAGRINIDVLDVTLVDGYKPSVGGYRPSVVDFEPAIWFKVMVLDAVTVDCDERRLSWVPHCDSSVSNMGISALDSGIALCGSYRLSSSGSTSGDDQRHLIDCGEDSLCGEPNEAFDKIPDLLAFYENNQLLRDDFTEQLMQLLHKHVLPSIRLTSQDADNIAACIQTLEVIINQIDADILEVAEKIHRVEQSLAGLRKTLLSQHLSDERKANSGTVFPNDFIDLLLSKGGLQKDIEIAWAAVERAQVAVEKLKENPEANDAALRSRRAERDLVQAEYHKLLDVREKLKELRGSRRGLAKRVRDVFSPAHVHEDQQQKIYVGIISKLTEFENLNEMITRNKLLVTSVKEAARLALNDIHSGSDSFGIEVDCVGAAHSTDVLGGNIRAPWQSLAEQIASILVNSSHRIAKLHREFCYHIADTCSATAVEKQLYDESVQAIQCNSNRSSGLKTGPCHGMKHSISSGSMSEFQLDLNNATFYTSDCTSNPGGHGCQLSKSMELSTPGGDSQPECLVRSLPVLQTQPSEISGNSVFFDNVQKADQKLEYRTGTNLGSSRKKKSSSLTPSFKSYVPRGLISVSQKDSDRDSPVIIVDTGRDCVRETLESIREEILDHFDTISKQLQNELSASLGKSQYKQIWLDYENHFYQEMMIPLTQLYQLQYANITDAFCSSLLELTPHDLGLDEAVLIHLLRDQHDVSMSSLDICSPSVCESKDSSDAESSSRSSTLTKCEDPPVGQMPFGTVNEDQLESNPEEEYWIRLLRSHSEESKRPRMRTVRISMPVIILPRSPTSDVAPHSPKSVLVYERTLAPLPSERSSLQSNTRLTLSATTMMLKPRYRQQFASALKHIESAIDARTPGSKLRHLTDCLRETTKQLTAFYAELYGDSSCQSSCDELLDAVVILLCNVNGHQMALLYCQLSLLADLMAPWLVRGPYSFTLVQFTGACQFIQERLMMKRNRHISKQAGSFA